MSIGQVINFAINIDRKIENLQQKAINSDFMSGAAFYSLKVESEYIRTTTDRIARLLADSREVRETVEKRINTVV